jgi:hypothetical protein
VMPPLAISLEDIDSLMSTITRSIEHITN